MSRKSKSGIGTGGSGGSAKSVFDKAEKERKALANIDPSKRTPEQNQQLNDVITRRDNAAVDYVMQKSTNSMIENEMNKYIDDAIKEEGVKVTEKWVKVLAGTKKDGSPTKTASNNAKYDRADDIAMAIGRRIGTDFTPTFVDRSKLDKLQDKMVGPIMQVARNRMKSGSLK